MHLIFKHHFHNTADFVNEPGSILLMKFHVSNASINRLCILFWDQPGHMLDMHIVTGLNLAILYFGTLVYHFRDLTRCPNKPGVLK
jgi:hypothetical protein